tara:strand:+ start:9953 stop:10624 length:672 start_codon:yes stop_codon:yes gene_type:complete
MKKYSYDTDKYPFRKITEEYLKISNLEKLHEDNEFEGVLTAAGGDYADQKQQLHRRFYDRMDQDTLLKERYDHFIKEIVAPLFEEEVYFQKYPTFRIHQPDNIAVFEFHKDKTYNHPEGEVNIYLPITKAYDSNTIWAESEEDKGDHAPMNADYGEFYVWDGNNLEHGNKLNETGQTRISFDFRVITKSDYNNRKDKGGSVTSDTKFILGQYYDKIPTFMQRR